MIVYGQGFPGAVLININTRSNNQMAKTTKEFIKNGEDTAKLNAERQNSDNTVEAPKAHPFVPDEGITPDVPEVLASASNPAEYNPAVHGLRPV